jgi:SusD family.
LPNPRYNNKVYTNPALRASIGHRFGYWMNLRVLRYADVLLMFAEAANEVGGTDNIIAALAALNSVRARARVGAPAGTLPDITTTDQDELREAIRHERRIELAMEHDRFFDLVRWGIAQDVLNAVGKTNFSNARDVLLPIPQTQIDLSAGVLTQNPGY